MILTKSSMKRRNNEIKQRINARTNVMDVSNSASCRICKTCSGNDLMKSPCLCKGSLGYVHFRCLETWLNQACRDSCELCQYRFNAIRSRRYTLLRSLRIWVSNPIHRNYLCYDLAITLILTALTIAIAAICLTGMGVFMRKDGSSLHDPFVRAVIMVFLFILISSYFTTLYLIIQDHIRPWYRWWKHCVNVKLLIDHTLVHGQPATANKMAPANSVQSKEMMSLEHSCSSSSLNMPRKQSPGLNTNIETI